MLAVQAASPHTYPQCLPITSSTKVLWWLEKTKETSTDHTGSSKKSKEESASRSDRSLLHHDGRTYASKKRPFPTKADATVLAFRALGSKGAWGCSLHSQCLLSRTHAHSGHLRADDQLRRSAPAGPGAPWGWAPPEPGAQPPGSPIAHRVLARPRSQRTRGISSPAAPTGDPAWDFPVALLCLPSRKHFFLLKSGVGVNFHS